MCILGRERHVYERCAPADRIVLRRMRAKALHAHRAGRVRVPVVSATRKPEPERDPRAEARACGGLSRNVKRHGNITKSRTPHHDTQCITALKNRGRKGTIRKVKGPSRSSRHSPHRDPLMHHSVLVVVPRLEIWALEQLNR